MAAANAQHAVDKSTAQQGEDCVDVDIPPMQFLSEGIIN
jgi:hypothetical protein